MGMHVKANGTIKYDSAKRVRIDCPLDAADFVPGSDSIVEAMIEDGAVTTDKIADGDVTIGKMAANSIDSDQYVDGSIDTIHLSAGAATLPKITTTGIKVLRFDGVDSTGGDEQVTLTGAAIGDRVVALWGVVSSSGASTIPTLPTHFEATITVTNKIIQKQAAADLSGNDYWIILFPATA